MCCEDYTNLHSMGGGGIGWDITLSNSHTLSQFSDGEIAGRARIVEGIIVTESESHSLLVESGRMQGDYTVLYYTCRNFLALSILHGL